jgi:fructoselysine-6-P-deglycase FrlB-like protein
LTSVGLCKYIQLLSDIEQEVSSEPASWERAVAKAPEVGEFVQNPAAHVVVLGCGTSYYMAQAFARLREDGGGVTDAFVASEVPSFRSCDRIVAISRSGTSSELVHALERARGRIPITAVTGVAGTPVDKLAEETVLLDFADERSVVQTRFATSTMMLLRAALGQNVTTAIIAGRRALAAELPSGAKESHHFVFLGHGWTIGLASEAALKLREASGVFAEAFPALEYRHGPISSAGPGTVVWMFDGGDGDLADDVAQTGAAVVKRRFDPVAELVLVHRMAVVLAQREGRDPDRPPFLTRSVVRP